MLSQKSQAEIKTWTTQNRLVREVYFLERAIEAMPPSWWENAEKQPCAITGCETKTKAKSGICREHQIAVRSLREAMLDQL